MKKKCFGKTGSFGLVLVLAEQRNLQMTELVKQSIIRCEISLRRYYKHSLKEIGILIEDLLRGHNWMLLVHRP